MPCRGADELACLTGEEVSNRARVGPLQRFAGQMIAPLSISPGVRPASVYAAWMNAPSLSVSIVLSVVTASAELASDATPRAR